MQIWYLLGCAVSKGPQQGYLWSPFRVSSRKKRMSGITVIERPRARKSPRFFGHFESVICKARRIGAERGKAYV